MMMSTARRSTAGSLGGTVRGDTGITGMSIEIAGTEVGLLTEIAAQARSSSSTVRLDTEASSTIDHHAIRLGLEAGLLVPRRLQFLPIALTAKSELGDRRNGICERQP